MPNVDGHQTTNQRAAAKMAEANVEVVSDGTMEGTYANLVLDDGTRIPIRNVIRVEIYLSAQTRSCALRIMNIRTKLVMPQPTTKVIDVTPHPDSPIAQGLPMGPDSHNL